MEIAILGLILFVLAVIAALGAGAATLMTRGRWRRLEQALRDAEARIARLEGMGADPRVPGAPPPAPSSALARPDRAATSAPPSPFRPSAPVPPPAPGRSVDLETLVGGQWLTWIGVLTLFFGTAFFLSADLGSHGLAGMGQVVVGTIVGGLFILVGRVLSGRAQRFLGRGLLGGGIGLLFLAAYAAFAFHQLIAAGVVYPFLLGVAAVGAVLALSQNSLTVASLTAIGALLTPLLLQQEGESSRALFPYLVIVNLGVAVVAARRHWSALPLIGFAGTVLLTLLWWDAHYSVSLRGPALAGTGSLWVIYFVLPLVSVQRRGFWGVMRTLVVVLTAFGFLAAMLQWLRPEQTAFGGSVAAVLALLYVVVARVLPSRASTPAGRATYYTGIALAAVAIPIQFEGSWITLGWALLGLVLLTAGLRLPSRNHRAFGLAVTGLGVARLLTWDTARALREPGSGAVVLNPEFLGGLGVVLAVAGAAVLLHRHRDLLGARERTLVTVTTLAATLALLWRISVEVIAAYQGLEVIRNTPGELSLATLLTLSLIWAVYAGLAIAVGFATRYRPLRLFGVFLLGVLVIKVFLLDMQALDKGYRITSFVGVGLLLLVISLLYQRERKT